MAMEQIGKYWGLWAPSTRSSSEPSWEEQAFARDAAAHLGGCVWPPRSYACSFCHREFRSAQALGGHMNVHRRDRALLRQGSSPDDDDGQEAAASRGEQPKQGPVFCRAASCSNPSTTAAAGGGRSSNNTAFPAAKGDVNRDAPPPPPYYLASIIKESKNKRLFVSIREVMEDQSHDDVESGRMKRRCLLDPPRPSVAVSMAAASESRGLQGIIDPDTNKVPTKTVISSPSSIPPLLDLELRLGTSPKVT